MTTPMLAAVATVLSLLLALVGCGADEPTRDPVRTSSNGEKFNDADVAFATDMIPHHAQALSMVDLTIRRPLDPGVQRLVEDIRTAQASEIEAMTDWLTAWGEPVPETMRDHANAHGDGDLESSDLPGMMSADQLAELGAAPDATFQHLFLEMMIEHHEGAIAMAEDEQSDGHFEPALELAASIESSQTEEIELMRTLLGD